METFDRYSTIQAGLVEIFLGPTGIYFSADNDARDIIDGFDSIFEACELRASCSDGETQEALSDTINVKVQRLRALLGERIYD